MQQIPRGVYTKEFREQAVRLVLEEGLSIPQAGQRLSMSPKTLRATISTNALGASAPRTEADTSKSVPTKKVRRRP